MSPDGRTLPRTVTTMSKSSSSINLAALYRPLNFSTLTGQRHVVAVLKRAVQDNLTPQQLLFSGGSGLGKTTVARILASALLCTTSMGERLEGDSCGRCRSCEALMSGSHPDLIEFDAASNGSKDEIREIAARAQVSPMLSSKRIYIIDEAHGLSSSGGQAFLKLLEEPPSHVMFMLCTTDPHKMLKTNRGRCTEFELLSPTRNELIGNLLRICSAEGWNCQTPILEMVVDCTDPDLGVRGTVNMLSKLSSALASSKNLTVEEASVLLGRASAELAASLLEAIFSGSESKAKKIILALRESSSEEAIRLTLLDLTRAKLSKVPNSVKDPRAFRAFEEIVTLPKGRHWLDLYVVRLCREFYLAMSSVPGREVKDAGETQYKADIEGSDNSIDSHSKTSRRIEKLVSAGIGNSFASQGEKGSNNPVTNTTTESKTFATNVYADPQNYNGISPSSSDIKEVILESNDLIPSAGGQTGVANISSIPGKTERGGGSKQPNTFRTISTSQPDLRSSVVAEASSEGLKVGDLGKTAAGSTETTEGVSRSGSESSTPGVKFPTKVKVELTPSVGFIEAVSKIDPDLAGALNRCDIDVQDSVVIRYKSPMKGDIEAGQKILRQVAGRAGLALQLIAL